MARAVLVDRFLERAKRQAKVPAYYIKSGGEWVPSTWQHLGEQARSFAKGLLSLGLAEGERVAILGYNRPEWTVACIGAQMAGGVSAGIYTTCSPEEVAHVISHSESPIVVVENIERLEKQILPKLDELDKLKHIIVMEAKPGFHHEKVQFFDDILAQGRNYDEQILQARIAAIREDQIATLIYTSGTTGPAKAVMLSHKNVDWTAQTAVRLLNVGEDDTFISYLPLAHIAEQMFSVYAPIASGMTLYFASSMESVPEHLKEVQPTLFFGVPRVYEKFFDKVNEKLSKVSGPKAWLFSWATSVARKVWEKKHASVTVPAYLGAQYALARKLVFKKLKPQLGFSKARVCVTGAAPISADILSFFLGLDIPIYEVYGQSEDCGPTSFNFPGSAKIGSAGRPFPGVQVRIADDGEIMVKGPNVFLGYFKDDAATKECFTDGWLHSGDIGTLDKAGFLDITERKKDLLITAGGKNIAPQNLEQMLKQIPLIAQAVVIGDRRKYLSALLTPNTEGISNYAVKMGIANVGMDELIKGERIRRAIDAEIEKINHKLAPVEQIKKFKLLPKDFTIESGELTPTMKIKRKVVNSLYADEINSLYCVDR